MIKTIKLKENELEKIIEIREQSERVEKLHGVVNHKYRKSEMDWLVQSLGLEGKITGGNYFQTPNPFHVHTDTGKRHDLGELDPKWNIVVPLMEDPDFKTVIFEQQWKGNASHFWIGSLFKYFPDPVYNERKSDLYGVENLTNKPFDVNDYINYMTHLPYENLYSMSIKQVVEWKLGEAIIFDSTLLHSSSNFTPKTKAGLTVLVSS